MINEASVWTAVELLHNSPDFRRQPVVVRIQKGNEFAPGFLQAQVEGRSLAAIRLVEILNSRTVLLHALGRVVGRTVVYNDDFQLLLGKVLIEDAVNGLFDETAIVISVNQNRNKRGSHSDDAADPSIRRTERVVLKRHWSRR